MLADSFLTNNIASVLKLNNLKVIFHCHCTVHWGYQACHFVFCGSLVVIVTDVVVLVVLVLFVMFFVIFFWGVVAIVALVVIFSCFCY